jgi:hypothetical protein
VLIQNWRASRPEAGRKVAAVAGLEEVAADALLEEEVAVSIPLMLNSFFFRHRSAWRCADDSNGLICCRREVQESIGTSQSARRRGQS